MLEVGIVVIGVSDPERAAAFYTQALGYERRPPRRPDEWIVTRPVTGRSGPLLALDVSESPPQDHPRIHLDLHARDRSEMLAEVERLVSLGAQRVDWDGYPDDPAAPNYDKYVVLADPEGNHFCVVDGSDEPPQADSRG